MDTKPNALGRRAMCTLAGIALFFSAASFGHAGELSLLVNGKAIHFNEPEGANWNEKNWGAGLHYEYAAVSGKWVPFLTASGFLDSNRNRSYYAGGGAMRRFPAGAASRDLHFDLGAVGFLMKRVDFKNDRPFLGVLPAVSLGAGPVALNVTYVPKVDPKSRPLVFFQLKITVGEF